MKVKQAQLRVTASEESSHMTRRMTTPNPPNRNIVLATDLQPWSQQATPTDPSPQMYPYDRYSTYMYTCTVANILLTLAVITYIVHVHVHVCMYIHGNTCAYHTSFKKTERKER